MVNFFISYRGTDRSRVREVIKDLKKFGLGHNILHDLDEGDQRIEGSNFVYEKIVRPILQQCESLILLIGDTTANPKITLKQELNYAITNEWDIFGVSLTQRTGGPPPNLEEYEYYFQLEYNPSNIVSNITKRIPND